MAYSTAYSSSWDTIPPAPSETTPLTDLRTAVAAVLATIPEVAAGDWQVLAEPVDMAEPPVFLLVWGPDPWGQPLTMCYDTTQLQVVCVSARLTPEATYPILERMVDRARMTLADNALRPWQWLAPGPFEHGGVTYLAARLFIRQPVTTLQSAPLLEGQPQWQ